MQYNIINVKLSILIRTMTTETPITSSETVTSPSSGITSLLQPLDNMETITVGPEDTLTIIAFQRKMR